MHKNDEVNENIRELFEVNDIPVPTVRTLSKWVAACGLQKVGFRIGHKKLVAISELHTIANVAWALGVGMSRRNVFQAIKALSEARKYCTKKDKIKNPDNPDQWIHLDFFRYALGTVQSEFVAFTERHVRTTTKVFRFESRPKVEPTKLQDLIDLSHCAGQTIELQVRVLHDRKWMNLYAGEDESTSRTWLQVATEPIPGAKALTLSGNFVVS